MKAQKTVWLLFISATLVACNLPTFPETAQGMRELWKQHPGEKYYPQLQTEVPLPFDKVVQHVKSKAQECLDVTMNVSERTDYGGTAHWQNVFTPKMTVNGKKAELSLIETMPGNFGSQQHIPQITADFTAVSANSTKVVIYHLSYNPSLRTAQAVAAWAAGKNVGCPDMNR